MSCIQFVIDVIVNRPFLSFIWMGVSSGMILAFARDREFDSRITPCSCENVSSSDSISEMDYLGGILIIIF